MPCIVPPPDRAAPVRDPPERERVDLDPARDLDVEDARAAVDPRGGRADPGSLHGQSVAQVDARGLGTPVRKNTGSTGRMHGEIPVMSPPNRPMIASSSGAVNGWSWANDGLGYSLVGSVPSNELHSFADDVRSQVTTAL